MKIVAGIDIGNATTETALARLDGDTPVIAAVKDRAVGFHLLHQPCVGGQTGGCTFFLQQLIILDAHADTGTV